MSTAYWWNARVNFGDRLTPLLLHRFAGIDVEWAPFKDANIIVVGSILDMLPAEWGGIIAGSGKLFENTEPDFSAAKVLALRGPLTAKGMIGEYVIGDPGLLADELVVIEERDIELGLVPHWSDTNLEHRPEFLRYNPIIIRPSDDPLEVIASIGRCKKIVTSSLHGAILADAFNIPRRIEMTDIFAREGGAFKFLDYSASLGMHFEVGKTQTAPIYKVQDIQHQLFDVFESVGRMLHD